jgi:hypothetical protein
MKRREGSPCFVTPQRVRAYEPILRAKIAEGVAVRCVARPPHNNGSIPYDDGRSALDSLEAIGCIVDTRKDTHEKIVVVDGEILWFGSLNPLSHTSQTGEVMARLVSRDLAQQMAAFVAIKPSRVTETYVNLAMVKENPACACCNGRTYFVPRARNGAFWRCEEQSCRWTESTAAKKKTSKLDGADAPRCPECGSRWSRDQGSLAIFTAALIIQDVQEPLHQAGPARQSHQALETGLHHGGARQLPMAEEGQGLPVAPIGRATASGPARVKTHSDTAST